MTFLHRAYFKTASKKEWNTADTRKGLRHMTEGRVLWAEAQTHAGKLVHIVNIHQATSTHLELQQTVLHTLKGKLSRQPHATIMAGDFNADPTGRRAGYAQSNAAHIQEVDEVIARHPIVAWRPQRAVLKTFPLIAALAVPPKHANCIMQENCHDNNKGT